VVVIEKLNKLQTHFLVGPRLVLKNYE